MEFRHSLRSGEAVTFEVTQKRDQPKAVPSRSSFVFIRVHSWFNRIVTAKRLF
jgi:hypothetical protein